MAAWCSYVWHTQSVTVWFLIQLLLLNNNACGFCCLCEQSFICSTSVLWPGKKVNGDLFWWRGLLTEWSDMWLQSMHARFEIILWSLVSWAVILWFQQGWFLLWFLWYQQMPCKASLVSDLSYERHKGYPLSWRSSCIFYWWEWTIWCPRCPWKNSRYGF